MRRISQQTLERLRVLQRAFPAAGRPRRPDLISGAIKTAYALRHDTNLISAVQILLANNASAKAERRLVKGIQFLGRVKSAYYSFLVCAKTMALFRKTTVRFVEVFPRFAGYQR